jgi:hypothetical protein
MNGRVIDPSGAAISGVRVVVSSSNLMGTRELVTDRGGHFRVLALPPGEYSVRMTKVGRHQIVVDRLYVRIGEATAVPAVVMQSEALELAPVRVTAPKELLDPFHTDVGASLTAADYSRLPGDRDYTSLIATLPHANESYRGDPVNVAGATGLENMYFIDGLNVTAPLHAERGTSLPYNFVRAVQVKVGGYEAQYGEALGAVVNAVTYSGTNNFEVAGFAFGTHSSLASTPKAEPTLRQTSALSYDIGARISGPVIKDVLWYSAAYNPRLTRANKEIKGLGVFADERTANVFAGKLTWNAGRGRVTEFSLFGDPTQQNGVSLPEGVLVSRLTPLNADPYLTRVRTGGTAAILSSTYPVGKRIVIDASVGRSANRDSRDGGTEVARNESIFADYFANTLSGGFGRFDVSDAKRIVGTLRATVDWRGHELIMGGGYQDMNVSRLDAVSGGRAIERNSAGAFAASTELFGGPRVRNRIPTAYLQNSWRMRDRLTVNTGMRWSSQTLVGGSGRVAKVFQNEWQPRIGAVVRLGSEGRHLLSASAGRFYQALPLNMSSLMYVDGAAVYETFNGDPRVAGSVPTSREVYASMEAQAESVSYGNKAEHFDELTLGYEARIGSSSKLSVRALRHDLRSSFQWGFNGYDFIIGTPGERNFNFLPRPNREYAALEISAQGSWRRSGYRASYVRSRSRGNYTGFYEPDFGFANPGGNAGFIAPHQAVNSLGVLPNDIPHILKASAWREIGDGVTMAAVFSWRSGSPINEFAVGPVPGLELHRAFVVTRGTAGRTPSLIDLNWRTSYDARIGQLPRFRVLLDVFHIGNPQRIVQVDELHYQSNKNGVLSNPNPNYLSPVAYQPAMEARLGLEFGSR